MDRLLIFTITLLVIAETAAQQQPACTANGKFTWVSYACENKYPGCRDVFPFDAGNKAISNLCTKTDNAKKFAIEVCPKSCRFCCLTPEYNCPDKPNSPFPCEKVTKAMCEANDKVLREFLINYCPGRCGFCLLSKPDQPVGNCPPDKPSCVYWVANGFCDSIFYTPEYKRQYCGHACGICK